MSIQVCNMGVFASLNQYPLHRSTLNNSNDLFQIARRQLRMSAFHAIQLLVNFLLRGAVFCEDMGNWKAKLPVPKFILNGPPLFLPPAVTIQQPAQKELGRRHCINQAATSRQTLCRPSRPRICPESAPNVPCHPAHREGGNEQTQGAERTACRPAMAPLQTTLQRRSAASSQWRTAWRWASLRSAKPKVRKERRSPA